MTFTDILIRNLKPEDAEYTKREKGGFGVRVLPTGRKVFFFLYRVDGQRKFLNLGAYRTRENPDGITLADARTEYELQSARVKALKAGRVEGVDPVEIKKQAKDTRQEHAKAQTVSDLITEYITKHAKPTKKSWKDDERILRKDALAAWGTRKAKDIKKRDVVLLLESIVERGAPGSANNNFKIIRKMFRFAVQRDILEHSPCDGVVMPAPLKRGDRVLSESEIKTLWGKLDTCHASDEIRRAIKLILTTGQRPGEVLGMHSCEIDESGRWWTIPVERSKNKKAHRVYMTDTALDLIGPLEVMDKKAGEMKPKGFIFLSTCPKGKVLTDTGEEVRKVQPMWRQAAAKVINRNLAFPVLVKGKPVFDAKGVPVTENLLGIADFTPHDLRRTAATFMSQLGCMDEVIDAVLNHTKQGIIATYNLNRYDKEKQAALESWERKLISITTGKKADNVIPMQRKVS